MSMKVNKNGKEYSVGILPQSIIDKVLGLYSKEQISLSDLTDITVHSNPSYKNGNMAQIQIVLTTTASASGWKKIATVDTPPSDTWYLAVYDAGNVTPLNYCQVTTNGDVNIRDIPNGTVLLIIGSYFII